MSALLTFIVKVSPYLIMVGLQLVLHLTMSFSVKSAVLGSIANLTTLWRPTHNELHNKKTLRFYRYNTLLSSVIHIFEAFICLLLDHTVGEGTCWSSLVALALGCISFFVSQVYVYCLKDSLCLQDCRQKMELQNMGTNVQNPESNNQTNESESTDNRNNGISNRSKVLLLQSMSFEGGNEKISKLILWWRRCSKTWIWFAYVMSLFVLVGVLGCHLILNINGEKHGRRRSSI